jgi:hypothetical protein
VSFIKMFPLTTLITWGTTVLAVLVYLQSSGHLTGAAAQWTNLAAGILQVLLTAYARSKVTPVVDPKDDLGRKLVPSQLVPPPR